MNVFEESRIVLSGNSFFSYSKSGVDTSNTSFLPKLDVIFLVSGTEIIASTRSHDGSKAFFISI